MSTDTALHTFASFEDAKNIVANYLIKYVPQYVLEVVLQNDEIIIWGNEFIEFVLSDKNGNGFIEVSSVEIRNDIIACFHVPMILSDFVKVMKIVNP